MAVALNDLLAPIQKAYQESSEWKETALKAYPPPPKKEKKVKNKGSRHPGSKDQDTTGQDTKDQGAASGVDVPLPHR